MSRVGCPNVPESLSHYNECPRLYNFLSGDVLLCVLREIISSMTRSPMCVLAKPPVWDCGDALHRRVCLCSSSAPPEYRESRKLWCLQEKENPLHDGFHSCLRSRLSSNLLTRHMPAVPRPTPRYLHLHNIRTTTCERSDEFKGWANCTDGSARLVDGETFAGGVLSLDLSMEELILCLVRSSPLMLILLRCQNSLQTHCCNVDYDLEQSFLGHRGLVAVLRTRVIF